MNRGEFAGDGATSYRVGDKVTFRGHIFECIKHVSRLPVRYPTDDPAHWEYAGPDLLQLRAWINGRFGIRLQSTGDNANLAQARILLETADASPENPYLVRFDQFILTPFTGDDARFDLVERDANDDDVFDTAGNVVSGGESQVTLATKTGFTDGDTTDAWSRFAKVITSNKRYSIIFVPGTAGDGIYSVQASGMGAGQLPQQPNT